MTQFVPFDEFDQNDKFPHKSSRRILGDVASLFQGILSVKPGINITIDDTDPENPIVNGIPFRLPQSTPDILGGLRLGAGLSFNPFNGRIDVTLGEEGGTTNIYQAFLAEDVTSSLNIGNISFGETLPTGMLFTDFVKKLLMAAFYPTYVAQSMALSSSLAGTVEAGTISDITLTATFSRGQIRGSLVSGTWNFTTIQDYLSGSVSSYVLEGVNTGVTANRLINAIQITDGVNMFSGTTNYNAGPQPTDSNGADFQTFLPSGSINATATVNGCRSAFHDTSSVEIVAADTSAEVRAFDTLLLNPTNGTNFTINIVAGTTRVSFAYPSTLQAVTFVSYIEGFGVNVKDAFVESMVMVEGANGYTAVAYRVYTFVPLEPFTSSATYNVTV